MAGEDQGLIDLLMAQDSVTASDRARALSARLRRQGILSGAVEGAGGILGPVGRNMGAMAQHEMSAIPQIGIANLHYAPVADELRAKTAARLERQKMLANPATGRALGMALSKTYGMRPEDVAGLPPEAGFEMLKQAGRVYQADQPKYQGMERSGYILNTKTGKWEPAPQAPTPGNAAADRAFENAVQKLGKDVEFLNTIPSDLSLLKSYTSGGDRPGGGPFVGRFLPDFMVSQEGNALRQASQRLINAIIYMSTGKQINEAEAKCILRARGMGPEAAEPAFREGVRSLEREAGERLRNFKARYKPEVVEEFKNRGGWDTLAELESGLPAQPYSPPVASPSGTRTKTYNPTTGKVE